MFFYYLCRLDMTDTLEYFLPQNAISFIKKWLEGHLCHIKVTKDRKSKLGDYRLMPDKSHIISINGNLDNFLFFFVMTHEIAHLLAFYEKRNIPPHGKEWKAIFRKLLVESLHIYPEDLQILLLKFAKNPKANFMSSPDLVKYFDKNKNNSHIYVEDLIIGEQFIYQTQTYIIEEKKKKRYLCKNLHNGKKYLFKSCARVEKLNRKENE